MWVIRSLFISAFVAFIFGVISTAMSSSFIEYKDLETASETDYSSMTYEQSEQWFKENTTAKVGFEAVQITFSDWLVFRYWLIDQWLIFLACFICCLVTHKLSTKNVS